MTDSKNVNKQKPDKLTDVTRLYGQVILTTYKINKKLKSLGKFKVKQGGWGFENGFGIGGSECVMGV